MDSAKNKIWMGWAALVFIVLHFGLIFNFALPEEYSSQQLKSASSFYIEPIFSQQWSMFAPCPVVNAEVEAKFYFESDSTDWIKTGEKAKEYHGFLRGSHHGELIIGESNLAFWFTVDLHAMGIEYSEDFPTDRMSEFYGGKSYYKIRSYLIGNSKYLFGKQAKAARIRFLLEDVTSGDSNLMELPIYKFE